MQNRGYKKYRSETVRLKSWNYGWNGVYFVTICTHQRKCYFGEIVKSEIDNGDTIETQDFVSLRSNSDTEVNSDGNAEMQLSPIGKIAQTCWKEIPDHFPFVKLGAHIIMPNHVHGIIIIDKKDDGRKNVETQNFASLHSGRQKSLNKFGPQSRNLASIIRGYKIGITKGARKIDPDFNWQPKYHDRIIRNRKSYDRISEYIRNNPNEWAYDKYYS
ncbi:MAG TPA: hypothetical protein DD671_12415 [Balneolaceae bacterium]|nr:hypothetical protein [Balneolaceae bacterium]